MRMVIISAFAVALLGVVVMLVPRTEVETERVPETLSEYGRVGEFQFVNQEGVTFSSDSLKGKVWLAGFVFTSCAVECPVLTRKMVEVREEIGSTAETAFVSFSVDPQTDTPDRLRVYASRFGNTDRWNLLTGDTQSLDTFIKNRFLLPTAMDYQERAHIASTGFIHSNKLLVVDQSGAIRYFADGMESGAVDRLSEAMQKLL